ATGHPRRYPTAPSTTLFRSVLCCPLRVLCPLCVGGRGDAVPLARGGRVVVGCVQTVLPRHAPPPPRAPTGTAPCPRRSPRAGRPRAAPSHGAGRTRCPRARPRPCRQGRRALCHRP